MSITAHLTEQFILKKKFSKFNIRWLIAGSYIPDGWGIDRFFMFYDTGFHRDYVFGWMHSLLLPIIFALPVRFIFGKWSFWSFLFSIELHILTDVLDTAGVKLLWPFNDIKYSVGIFPWYENGIIADLIIYFTTPASLIFELIFLIWAFFVIYNLGSGNIWLGLKKFWHLDSWFDK